MEILNKAGIYLIFNLENQRVYIGQSTNVSRRLVRHRGQLRNSKHSNTHLQRAFDKYGEDKFVFRSVEYCEIENLTEREEYWIGQFNSVNPNRGYNLMRARIHGGHSEETRAKISASSKGKIFSEEHRAKLSVNNKGNKGRALSEEHRANIGAGNKGKTRSEETRAKLSEASKGHSKSEETRAKLSAANKGKVLSEEHRAKIAEGNRGKTRSEETRAKMRASSKLRWERKHKESLC